MPQIWEKDITKVGVTIEELVPDWWPSCNALYKRINRDSKTDNYGIKRLRRSSPGHQLLINFDTLTREIQQALGDPRKHQHIMEKWYEWDADAVRFYNNEFAFGNGTYLSDRHKDEYILNASVLKAVHIFKQKHIAERSQKKKKPAKLYDMMSKQCAVFQDILRVKHGGTQHSLPGSERQFRNVYDGFFKPMEYKGKQYSCNYLHLISGKLNNDNARIVTDSITGLLDGLFAKSGSKPSKLKVARRYQAFKEGLVEVINTDTGESYQPHDFSALSDRSITKWLSEWISKAGTYSLRSSDRPKLLAQFSPSAERTPPVYAGSLISVDDRQPPFEYDKGKRVWLYNCLDVASDAIVATVWGKDKTGIILEFYRQILRNYTQWGIRLPAELEAEISLNTSFKETFLKPGAMFQYVRLEANNPRGKIIESRNRPFRYELEKEMEGWKGRPFAKLETNQALPKDNPYIEQKYRSYESLVKQSLNLIEKWNNSKHPRKEGISKWDYFLSMQHPDLEPTNWKAILPFLGTPTKSSCNVGKIRLQGNNHYLGDDGQILFGAELINRLKILEGQDVTVYWLDGNDGKILKALVYLGDTYVCEAIPVPKWQHARIERTDQDEHNRQLQSKYAATVYGYISQRKKQIPELVVIDHSKEVVNNNFVMPNTDPLSRQMTYADEPDEDDTSEFPEILPEPDQEEDDYTISTQRDNDILNNF